MKRPRIRLRTLMIAVAVAALPLGLWAGIERRRAAFDRTAAYHVTQVVGLTVGGRPLTPSERRRDEWHYALFLKYREAAFRPWIPVGPDPPEPE
jgi:hypothetical protein